MNTMKKNTQNYDKILLFSYIILEIILYTFLIVLLSNKYVYTQNKDFYNYVYENIDILGLWTISIAGERIITVRVENYTLEQISDTLRHELCHEIYYRLNYSQENKLIVEKFANNCNPYNYIISNYTEGGEDDNRYRNEWLGTNGKYN